MSNKIWIYLSNKKITCDLLSSITSECVIFLDEWNAHGTKLDAKYRIIYDHFLIFEVNEDHHHASGCSIDKQLQFVKKLEEKHQISLLNRLLVAYRVDDDIRVENANTLKQAIKNNELSPSTILFNMSISTTEQFEHEFEIPVSESWLMPKKITT